MSDADNAIIVCRCEDVTLGEIRKAIREGATTLDEVKRITRAGMGPCKAGLAGCSWQENLRDITESLFRKSSSHGIGLLSSL